MFDRSYLPDADLEFVVMTDTHYMLDPGRRQVEFESRRRQAARAQAALRLVAALDPAFVVHLGDLVQEFPESEGFAQSLDEALAQIAAAGVTPYQVAGNHDVGDKPDPTMPTDWVTPGSLRAYHQRFGPSWRSWDAGGCHFVILNSQIMNGPLSEAGTQRKWLEADLAAHADMPTFIFLHLAPFLVDEDEPALGHYDNIDEPARSWLLNLIRAYPVRALFAGHSHFAFFNRIADARSYVVPSTAFTRPGFCQVFASEPPPERGRDDAPKLGFFLVRVTHGQPAVHLIRTSGETSDPRGPNRRLVSGISRELPRSPLGIILRHQLAPAAEVPIAWQSNIRQPVRNDYPLLACIELGARQVRVPAADLAHWDQRQRLAMLREEGVAVIACWIWSDRCRVLEDLATYGEIVDGVEFQLPGSLAPDAACLAAMDAVATQHGLPITLSPLLPREPVAGKQHARTRIGYHLEEVGALNQALAAADVGVDRVLCRIDANASPTEFIRNALVAPPPDRIGHLDWALEFDGPDPAGQTGLAAAALGAIALMPGSRLWLEPLIDFDRTMDVPRGLLDRRCNPHPAFHVVRALNTLLFAGDPTWTETDAPAIAGAETLRLTDGQTQLILVIPTEAHVEVERAAWERLVPAARCVTVVDLETAMIAERGFAGDGAIGLRGPAALVLRRRCTSQAALDDVLAST